MKNPVDFIRRKEVSMILDMEKELQKTLHLDSNDLPYAEVEDGIEFRILHARPEEGYYVTQLRVQPGYVGRSEEHTSELQSLMRISYAVFCLKKKKQMYTMK